MPDVRPHITMQRITTGQCSLGVVSGTCCQCVLAQPSKHRRWAINQHTSVPFLPFVLKWQAHCLVLKTKTRSPIWTFMAVKWPGIAVLSGNSMQQPNGAVSTALGRIFKRRYKMLQSFILNRIRLERSDSARDRRISQYIAI